MMSLRWFSLVFLLLTSTLGIGQSSNIYAFEFNQTGDELALSNASILTAFNAAGKNTNPAFINDNVILISSDHFDKTQSDIIKLDLTTKRLTRLTHTPESETYPQLRNNGEFSVLLDNRVSTKLHSYPMDLSNGGTSLYNGGSGLEAYTWSPNKRTLYIRDRSGNLSSLDAISFDKSLLLDNVKSRMLIDKYKNVIIAHDEGSKGTFLKKYDTTKQEYKTYGKIVGSSKVIAYLSNHKVLAAVGSKLYLFNLVTTSLWDEVADLSEYGIDNVSDMIIQRNRLIVVAK